MLCKKAVYILIRFRKTTEIYNYCLIRFAQTNMTIFSSKTRWIRENKSFLLVEPCSRVTCCLEIKLQFFFLKYIYLHNLYPTSATYFGDSSWLLLSSWWQQLLGKTFGLRYQNGATVSDSFAKTKTRSCRQHGLMFSGWHFKSRVCVCWAIMGNDATKNIQCNNIYHAKMDWTYNAKIAADYWNTYLVTL